MYCKPTKVLPAVVHPTKCCVNHNFENIVVPHVYPTHTTTVNHTNYQQQQHFPHSQSMVNEVTSTNIGPVQGPPPRPTTGFGNPGMVAGAQMGPGMGGYPGMGMGPGPGMGGYPGMVGGAHSGPGMGGYPGMVGGAHSGPGMGFGKGPRPGCFR